MVDLGGGTADLVMHGFKEVAGRPRLIELTKGTGDMCGGGLLDDLFYKHLIKKVPPEDFISLLQFFLRE